MTNFESQAIYHSSNEEVEGYRHLVAELNNNKIPENEVLANLGLFLTRSSFGRLLFFYELYSRVLQTPGVIMEFGVRWGANMAFFNTLRSLLEPYNQSRKIIGFDTFSGFPSVDKKDGAGKLVSKGALSVEDKYEEKLEKLLAAHEKLAPRSNVRKFELVKGDITETLPKYLDSHPETVISLLYFDLDLYKPTKACLEIVRPFLVKNSVVAFDQLALAEFPGETIALREKWGLDGYRIIRSPHSPQQSYLVFE